MSHVLKGIEAKFFTNLGKTELNLENMKNKQSQSFINTQVVIGFLKDFPPLIQELK